MLTARRYMLPIAVAISLDNNRTHYADGHFTDLVRNPQLVTRQRAPKHKANTGIKGIPPVLALCFERQTQT